MKNICRRNLWPARMHRDEDVNNKEKPQRRKGIGHEEFYFYKHFGQIQNEESLSQNVDENRIWSERRLKQTKNTKSSFCEVISAKLKKGTLQKTEEDLNMTMSIYESKTT